MKRIISWIKQYIRWSLTPQHRGQKIFLNLILLAICAFLINRAINLIQLASDPRSQSFVQWAGGNSEERASLVTTQQEACPDAPFILPTEGFIGLLYEDPRGPYSSSNPHQGIDIFSEGEPGTMPVYAAYDGYITRDASWRSALIQRIPEDPLRPGEQIWLYYAHMADQEGNSFIEPAFPPGTSELFIEQGTLLGYTGDYNGNSTRSIWVHLHFSIVKDDGNGRYLNELEFNNTLDPSPYLGMALNYNCGGEVTGCTSQTLCVE